MFNGVMRMRYQRSTMTRTVDVNGVVSESESLTELDIHSGDSSIGFRKEDMMRSNQMLMGSTLPSRYKYKFTMDIATSNAPSCSNMLMEMGNMEGDGGTGPSLMPMGSPSVDTDVHHGSMDGKVGDNRPVKYEMTSPFGESSERYTPSKELRFKRGLAVAGLIGLVGITSASFVLTVLGSGAWFTLASLFALLPSAVFGLCGMMEKANNDDEKAYVLDREGKYSPPVFAACDIPSPADKLMMYANTGNVTAQTLIGEYAELEDIAVGHGGSLDVLRSEFSPRFETMADVLETEYDMLMHPKAYRDHKSVMDAVRTAETGLSSAMLESARRMTESSVMDTKAGAEYLKNSDGHGVGATDAVSATASE